MRFNWTNENEKILIKLRDEDKKGFTEIADILGTTVSSVKHKYVRIKQKSNSDKHHHPVEKINQIKKMLEAGVAYSILETHAGYGNLTKIYNEYGNVTSQEINGDKVAFIQGLHIADVIKCDSEKMLYSHIHNKLKFDVIDIDAYGYPSRFFPHIFKLMNDGYLFLTFPKHGINKINKITREHLRVFWGITTEGKEAYKQKILSRIIDYGFIESKKITLIDEVSIGRLYRFCFKVEKSNMIELTKK